ncbi:hypothetical protein H0E87_005724 [Populus deltoides]|uniref:Uncharacterized protein n=1 Tax=Populus deltoides TaxID=3696 RepID=A0A8T2ZKL7_POPDE|nr:hypothetical protein H0E87_005724 [Populus deltoides]
MATRVPECSVESCTGKQLEPVNSNHRLAFRKRFSDSAVDEKESCRSNEVSVQFDSLSIASNDMDGFKRTKSKLKATITISRRKTAPSYQCSKEQSFISTVEQRNIVSYHLQSISEGFMASNHLVACKCNDIISFDRDETSSNIPNTC